MLGFTPRRFSEIKFRILCFLVTFQMHPCPHVPDFATEQSLCNRSYSRIALFCKTASILTFKSLKRCVARVILDPEGKPKRDYYGLRLA